MLLNSTVRFSFLINMPRFVFFTGKGGVGKTSLACATATRLADGGARVLLVSTDPASNVAQVFGQKVGHLVTAIESVPGLDAVEIDPNEAAEAYREKIIGPVRGLLPEAEIAAITEELSGSCTTEIASFNEFTDILADDTATAQYTHVVFDTAPTGHTIRLLQLPGEWTNFIDAGKGDPSCLGPLSGLEKARTTYATALARLADPKHTRLVLVARAQTGALTEAARTSEELSQLGITEQQLVVNAVLPEEGVSGDTLATAILTREQAAMASLPPVLAGLSRTEIPLHAGTVVGIEAVRRLLRDAPALDTASISSDIAAQSVDGRLETLVDELAQADHGLIMCMGKGGVGKTTTAAAIALALTERGKQVHLSTTDPAAHLDDVLNGASADSLEVSRIDPETATEEYRQRVLASKGAGLDDVGRAQLAEDLLSPCTEEVAVFGRFSHLVSQARKKFVVMDTAPTGHTLLLMDTAGSYHREIIKTMGDGQAVTPLMRIQDPDLTKILIVTLPDATPVQEAKDLDADLRRAGITPWGWVVNQSLAAATTHSPLLAQRAALEQQHIQTVTESSTRVAVVPMLAQEPTGLEGLKNLFPQPL